MCSGRAAKQAIGGGNRQFRNCKVQRHVAMELKLSIRLSGFSLVSNEHTKERFLDGIVKDDENKRIEK